MADTDEQAKSNTFTDDGRLLQTEYAIKHVSKAGTIIGLVCTDGVILLGINPAPSDTVEKIYQLSENIYCVVSGIFSDALRLIKLGQLAAANIKETIGQHPRPSVLCDAIAERKQHYTQSSGARPFGVSFLYAGYDGEYVLYSTDPSGTVNRWRAWSYGQNEELINSGLINDLPTDPMDMETGLTALLRVLNKARESPPDASRTMEILLYRTGGSRMLTEPEIAEILGALEAETRGQ